MPWTVAIPAWGRRCVDLAIGVALPSMLAAAAQSAEAFRFIVHTDEPAAFADAFAAYPHELRLIPPDSGFDALVACHADILGSAPAGEFVSLLNADHIVSRETFVAAERRFAQGKTAIFCASTRTLGGTPPAPGATAGEVLDFTMRYPHLVTVDCTWPMGRSAWPSVLYFRHGPNSVMHGFHLHPYAIVARPGMAFEGSIDGALVECLAENEIHIVTDRDEMAIAEISPPGRTLGRFPTPNTPEHVGSWAASHVSPRHRWLFRHRITLQGDPEALSYAPVNAILSLAEEL